MSLKSPKLYEVTFDVSYRVTRLVEAVDEDRAVEDVAYDLHLATKGIAGLTSKPDVSLYGSLEIRKTEVSE